jgi:hypothetical protein
MIILEYMIISSNKKISIFLNINIFIKIYFTAFLLIIYDKLIFVDIMSLFDCLFVYLFIYRLNILLQKLEV